MTDVTESFFAASTDHAIGGIMVEFYQHPALTENRRSARIHWAFAVPVRNRAASSGGIAPCALRLDTNGKPIVVEQGKKKIAIITRKSEVE